MPIWQQDTGPAKTLANGRTDSKRAARGGRWLGLLRVGLLALAQVMVPPSWGRAPGQALRSARNLLHSVSLPRALSLR